VKRVRTGVIGVGRFGRHHASALARLAHVDLVAVCDRNADRAQEVARAVGTDTARDVADLLARRLDAVTVATGIGDHRAPVLAALEAGCHVLCEKPLANTVAEIDAIAAAAERTGRWVMPGHVLRFDIHYQTVAARVASGTLGRIRTICCRRNVGRSHLRWHAPPFTPILETGLHDIDVIRWMTGHEVVRVYAVRDRTVARDIDDSYWAVLTLDDGAICGLQTSWLIPEGDPDQLEARLDLLGTAGRATVVLPNDTVAITTANAAEHPDTAYWPTDPLGTGGALRAELDYFTQCCLRGEPPDRVTIDDARRAVAVANAIHQSAEQSAVVQISPSQ